MKTLCLFPLELRRLFQSRLTWLIVGLTVLSPAVGLILYKPATASTMLSMYLANPAIAGGVVGGILFGLLAVFPCPVCGNLFLAGVFLPFSVKPRLNHLVNVSLSKRFFLLLRSVFRALHVGLFCHKNLLV